jgi:hypothetical protein
MIKIKKENYEKIILYLIFAVAFLLYSPLIFHGAITSYDDTMLMLPLKLVRSATDYFDALRTGAVLDIQPVRDLSFFIDLSLGGWFYLTNFLILIILSLQLNNLLDYQLDLSYNVTNRYSLLNLL